MGKKIGKFYQKVLFLFIFYKVECTLKKTLSFKAQTLTAPVLDPSEIYLPSVENFISFMSKID